MSLEFGILIVDDDEGQRSTLTDILEASSYEVASAGSGAEGIRLAEQNDFDLLIVDLRLPDMSGLEVLERVEAVRPSSEALMITGHASFESAAQAVRASTVGYLTKPVDIDTLLTIIKGVARRRALERENRELQRRISKAKQEWEKTFDAIADPIALADRSGRILRVNRAFEERFDSFEHVLGKQTAEVVFGPEAQTLAECVRQAASSGFPLQEETAQLTIPGVHEVWCYPLELAEGAGVILILREKTEQRRAEADRRRLEKQMQKIQRLESVGRLAGGIAHDFNNLLTVITGNLDLIEEDLAEDQDPENFVGAARAAARRAAELVSQLVTFSHQQSAEQGGLSLNQLLSEVEALLVRTLGEDVELRTVPASDLWFVSADVGQLTQVLLNLAANARDAMPDGGLLTIETRNQRLQNEELRAFPELAEGDYVVLVVTDTGIGMTEKVRAHAFEPFFTTKEVGKGTGLGLATCYGVAARSGGCVRVESEPNEGASFSIYLPRAGTLGEPASGQSGGDEEVRGHETILLVEDDDAVRATVAPGLRSLGYDVLEARNGAEAIRMVESTDPVDVMVTDIVMPAINGFELAQRVHEAHPQIEILLVSGYPSDSIDRRKGFSDEFAWLMKPYSTASLASEVRRLLDLDKAS
jgi:PAS domain S-box-containing protein